MCVYVQTFHSLHIIGKFESSLLKLAVSVPNSKLYLMHSLCSFDTFEKVEYNLFLLLQLLSGTWIPFVERNHAFGITHWEITSENCSARAGYITPTRSVSLGSKKPRLSPTRLQSFLPYPGSTVVWMVDPNASLWTQHLQVKDTWSWMVLKDNHWPLTSQGVLKVALPWRECLSLYLE